MSEETEGWGSYLGKFALKTGARIVMNYCVPGSGAAVDFIEAASDFQNGNNVGCAINIVLGVSEIVTVGITGSIKEAVQGSSKKVVKDVARGAAKRRVKMIKKKMGKELGKKLKTVTIAAGGKAAAIQKTKELVKATVKETTKQVGEKYGKEIAKGVVTKATEEVIAQGGKLTLTKMPKLAFIKLLSNGFLLNKDFVQDFVESLVEKTAEDIFVDLTKASFKNLCPIIMKVATTGAEEELEKHSWKLVAKHFGIELIKGGTTLIVKTQQAQSNNELRETCRKPAARSGS